MNLLQKASFVLFLSVSMIFSLSCSNVFAESKFSENLIPVMTSNNAPEGIASASSYNNVGYNLQPFYAFDHKNPIESSVSTYAHWESTPGSKTAWLAYEFKLPQVITKYSLLCRFYQTSNDGVRQAPRDWTFEGSNDDGLTWVQLDNHTDISDWKYDTKKEFSFENSTSFKKYRINITSNNGYPGIIGIGELEMMSSLSVEPHAPINLIASSGNAHINLNWDSVQDVSGYIIKRGRQLGGPYEIIATNVKEAVYSDVDVVNGITYYYVVTAVNASGESVNSNEASATPQAPVVQPDKGRAILTITLDTGLEKEYDLSMAEVNSFISWYEGKAAGSGAASYAIDKHDNNKGPFKSRKDYVIF